MKTSSEIYSWILNSSEFKPSNFTISYFDAIKKKYIDVALTKWKPIDREIDPGDIPWTRVYYIKWKNIIVWNRESKFCDLSVAVEEDLCLPSIFKIMSFNILSDIYDKKITNLDKRISQITNFISESNVDILCLQEVTDKIIPELEKTNYLIHKTDTKNNNIAILSKIPPITFSVFNLGNIEKQAIFCVFNLENNIKLNIVGIHLTSNTNRNAKSTRTQQINKILEYLSINGEPNSPTVILGDTNEPDRIEQLYNFNDSNGSTIFTYNSKQNLLASKISDTISCFRYDRIYTQLLKCNNFNVIENNIISDHYPIIGEYQIEEIIENPSNFITSTNKTSLCILLDHELTEIIPKYNKNWMQHINIFWPFIPEYLFSKYSDQIRENLKKINFNSFEIDLKKINSFDHEINSTIFYEFDDNINQRIRQIRKIVSKIVGFPNEEKFIHLSLELCNNDENSKQKIIQKYCYKNLSFCANALYMISCENSDEMIIRNMITFSKPSRQQFISCVINFFTKFNLNVFLCGSDIFEVSSDDSDIDILAFGNIDRNLLFNLIETPILQCGMFYKLTRIKNEHTYELKLCSDFISVDFHYVNNNDITEKYSQHSLTLYEDPNTILKYIKKHDLFKLCLRHIRKLFKDNKMYGQQYFYLSGISIAILTAFIFHKNEINTIEDFVVALSIFDFEQIISINKTTFTRENKSDFFLVILQPSFPYANTVRTIIKSTKLLITDILQHSVITINLENKKESFNEPTKLFPSFTGI